MLRLATRRAIFPKSAVRNFCSNSAKSAENGEKSQKSEKSDDSEAFVPFFFPPENRQFPAFIFINFSNSLRRRVENIEKIRFYRFFRGFLRENGILGGFFLFFV
eukprot:TRINITY_DN823_c1_g1_i1.p2 TRINITY_DN823_c1_g1~~TRINITY_DN823_c1_g1_i1.p2  ORF type:complete len:122 (-),score=59.41 TRINITY_DN823_c1_g1_i1:402-713(-)